MAGVYTVCTPYKKRGNSMKQTGRPPFKITLSVLSKARRLMAQGISKMEVASGLEISYSTLMQKQRKNEHLRKAMAMGREDYMKRHPRPERPVTKWSMQGLFLRARNHDTTAQIAFLSRYCPDEWVRYGIPPRAKREMAEKQRQEALKKLYNSRLRRVARKPKLTMQTSAIQPVKLGIYVGKDSSLKKILIMPLYSQKALSRREDTAGGRMAGSYAT